MDRIRWLVIAATAALLLAACSDDDESEEDGSAPAATEEDEGDGEDGAANDDADNEAVGSDELEDADLPQDLNDLLTDLDSLRAQYEFEGQDEDGNEINGNLTILALEGSLRIDFEGFGADDEEFTGSVIATTDAVYFCGENLQEGEEATCFEFAGAEDIDETAVPFGELLEDLLPLADEAGIDTSEAEQREIAGEDADCMTVTQEDVEGEALVCLADNGIPLLVEGTAEEGNFRLEATEVSEDVSPDDFEPPFPVQEFELGDLEGFELDDFDTSDDDQD